MTTQTPPVAYLVAERRDGQWILDDGWTHRCDTLDEARQVAAQWRSHAGYDPANVGVLAAVVVDDVDDPATARTVLRADVRQP